MNMLPLAIAVMVLLTVLYVISSLRANAALKRTKKERNEIYRNCFLKGLAGILAKMSAADGEATADEQKVVDKLFTDMGLADTDRRACREAYRIAKDSDLPGTYYASLFAPYSTRESRILVYEVLWDVAAADTRFAAGEEKMLRDILDWLELDSKLFDMNLEAHREKFASADAAIAAAGKKLSGAVASALG